MNPFEMVVLIVLLVTVGKVIRARWTNQGVREDRPSRDVLSEEVARLKERVAVLERIATDRNRLLEQEFGELERQ